MKRILIGFSFSISGYEFLDNSMKTFILIALLSTILSSCATNPYFHVNVNSLQRTDTAGYVSYIILPSETDVGLNDLEFIEYSEYVENALLRKGLSRTYKFDSADIAVFLSYGIGDPERISHSYSLPLWGKTGVAYSYTSGSANVVGNSASFTSTTTNIPQYGVVGSTTHSKTRIEYTRRASLTAFDLREFRETEKEIMLWDTRITSTGSSGDLRRVFPIMIAAASTHIGTDTGKMVLVKLKEDDASLAAIKGPSEPSSPADFMDE